MLKNFLLPLFLVLGITGCATTGGVTPQTAKQQLYYLDSQYTALVQTATTFEQNGQLHGAVAAKVNTAILNANLAINAAWMTINSPKASPTTTLGALKDVQTALEDLNSILAANAPKGAKP